MKFLLSLLLPLAAVTSSHAQIYADFQTSLGDFSCELNYTASPKTVANFIGLAEGSRPWIDPSTGSIQTGVPFYNGVTFHRVLANFMSQSGSKNGRGTDGPGYTFVDETSNGLNHAARHVLSMANSGKNSNSSEFFITDVPTPHLDGLHTVFGTVSSGGAVVDAINNGAVKPGTDGVPVVPVVIQTVTIRRIGSAAEAFNINAQNLPEISPLGGTLEVTPGQKVALRLPAVQPVGSVINVFRSADLNQWSFQKEIFRDPGLPGSLTPTIDEEDPTTPETEILPKAFYKRSLVTYTGALGPDRTNSRTLACVNGIYVFNFAFNADGKTGTLSGNIGASSPITGVLFLPGPYRTIWVIYSQAYVPFRVIANTASSTATQFTGTQTVDYSQGGSWQTLAPGTFTLSK